MGNNDLKSVKLLFGKKLLQIIINYVENIGTGGGGGKEILRLFPIIFHHIRIFYFLIDI